MQPAGTITTVPSLTITAAGGSFAGLPYEHQPNIAREPSLVISGLENMAEIIRLLREAGYTIAPPSVPERS